MLRRAALKTAGRPMSKFLESDTESESDAGSPVQTRTGRKPTDDASAMQPLRVPKAVDSPAVSDSDADSPAVATKPTNVSRFGWRNNLYDNYDSSPDASPLALRNGAAGRIGLRNPLYNREAVDTPEAKTPAGSAVAAWSEVEQTMVLSKAQPAQVLDSPSISSTMSYSPGASPKEHSQDDPKKGRAGAAVLSLEGQISELSMAIKEFKGISQLQAPRLAALEESIPRLQVAVEDISSWVEEIDSVLSESCGLQANMRESTAKYTEAIESFHSRMSAMESSLAQIADGQRAQSPTVCAQVESQKTPVKQSDHRHYINHATNVLPWAVVAVLLAWTVGMLLAGLDLNAVGGFEWVEEVVSSVTGVAGRSWHVIGMGAQGVRDASLGVLLVVQSFLSMAMTRALDTWAIWLPHFQSLIDSAANSVYDAALVSASVVRGLVAHCLLQMQELVEILTSGARDTVAMLAPKIQEMGGMAVEGVRGVVGGQ